VSVLDAVRLEASLGGSLRQRIIARAPIGWWRLAETSGVAKDSSGSGRPGTVSGTGVTRQAASLMPEGGWGYTFAGASSGSVSMGDDAAFEFNQGYTIEIFGLQYTTSTSQAIVSKALSPSGKGWGVFVTTGGKIRFFAITAAGASVWLLDTDAAYNDGLPHHVVAESDGSTNAITIYVDGVAVKQTTAGAGTPDTNAANFSIGSLDLAGSFFTGTIDDVVVYNTAIGAAAVAADYAATRWTDITEDVWDDPPLAWGWGILGSGPTDRVADAHDASGDLFNAAANSAGLEGYYSPGHVNQRTGFARGIVVRGVATLAGDDYPLFIGVLDDIAPEPGRNQAHHVPLVIRDFMATLIDADLREVALQIDKTEGELLEALIDSLPVTVQPLALDFDASLDTSPYAFHDLAPGVKAIQPATDIVLSALGYLYVNRLGHLRYENRQARQVSTSVFAIDDDMSTIEAPSDADDVATRFRLTIHPKRIDAAATTVLFSIPVASAAQPSTLAIEPGETVAYSGDYFNPSNVEQQIGGTAQVDPPVITTDYLANAADDGTGTNKSAAVTVAADFFGASVAFSIANTDPATVYITKLQCRGKGLYDEAPVTVEAISEHETLERPVDIDLPYQTSATLAQALADYLIAQFAIDEDQPTRAKVVTFRANLSDEFLLAALTLDVGDRITVTETVTGVTTVDVFVQGARFTLSRGGLLDVTLYLSPSIFSDEFWILEDPDSQLGLNTILAFA